MAVCQTAVAAQSEAAATTAQDASAGTAVTAPQAVRASTGEGRVALTWSAIDGAAGYRILRAVNGVWDRDPLATVTSTTHTIDGLTNGTNYAFVVAAYTTERSGPWSAAVTATPVAEVTGQPALGPVFAVAAGAPSADQNLTATDSNVSADADASTVASPRPNRDASSIPPATVGAATGVMFPVGTASPRVDRTAQPTTPQPSSAASITTVTSAAEAPAATAPRSDPPAVVDTTRAVSETPALTGTPTAAPAPAVPPASLTATGGDARVVLSWQAVSGAAGYLIFRSTDGTWSTLPLAVVSATTYTNTGLTNGTLYTYRVAAYDAAGTGPQSGDVSARPLASPKGLKAIGGDTQISLSWQASTGATSYVVFRSTSDLDSTFSTIVEVSTLSWLDSGLTNGTKYFYRVRALASGGASDLSEKMSAAPVEAPPSSAPANLVAQPFNARIVLTWSSVAGATSYRVFRTTTGAFDRVPIATVTTPTFTNTGLTNGTAYAYRVAARNAGGDGPFSATATATPIAAPPAPAAIRATGGDGRISVKWAPAPGATHYNVYRGTSSNGQAATPIASGLAITEFVDTVANGPTYYYKVTATNVGGESPRSAEASSAGDGPPSVVDAATQAAHRLLRHATWGPRSSDVDQVKSIGAAAFIDQQLSMGPSAYPDTLMTMPLEVAQEHFMQLALTAPDQLRQRVAWALHKIWVVSAVEVPSARAIVTYYRLLMSGAFGNYRDLMRAITLNPAMGRYLNMLNNRSLHVTGVPPNENYARELLQLFTLGVARLNPDGTPMLDASGMPIPAYTEADVAELARILTGWTFGDGDPATVPATLARENYGVPMEPVPAYHDPAAKVFLGQTFTAHQTASQDVDQALDILFNHPNVGPFISRQLIQQLVTSNPSPGYVAAVTAVFNNPGARGDLAAVVRAILLHPEASAPTATSGKLAEPVLFVVAPLRAMGATVTDHPFMSEYAEALGQKVFYPPSVFSYFSPGFRVRGTGIGNGPPLGGPEFQVLTSVTAMERANYIGSLIAGYFGTNVTIDFTPFTTRAADPAALVDYCNLLFLGGRMSPEERAVIIAAVRGASTSGDAVERVRTALYLTLVIAQSQVDR
jgi:uncharacterized protein (DUF1800 family)/fibronectin type 3 domain-containing protein